jgi:hypothetical protein
MVAHGGVAAMCEHGRVALPKSRLCTKSADAKKGKKRPQVQMKTRK